MPTIFTRIIEGELPARFVWRDDQCVVFTSINPLRPGHALVVPRSEVDHWLDLDADRAAGLMRVAHAIGQAQMVAFAPRRVALIIAGMEVPHCHLHVVPIESEANLSFATAERDPDPAVLDADAQRLRDALSRLGFDSVAN